ncbi:MAG: hypothetical protein IPL99_15465 [Candidatus Competibacteraceae bacterium]|nr:hypothetical protein [Candidatus Competibacteraceae bacterium]
MTAQPDSVTDNVAIKGVFVGCPIPDAPPHIHRLNLLFPYRHWSKAHFHCAKCGTSIKPDTPIVRCSDCYLCWQCYGATYGIANGLLSYTCEVCNRTVYSLPHRFTGVCSHRCQKAKTARHNRLSQRLHGPTKDCPICGRAIFKTTGRSDKTHCSPACRQKAYRQRQHDRPNAAQTKAPRKQGLMVFAQRHWPMG